MGENLTKLSKEDIEEYKKILEELIDDEDIFNSIKVAVTGTFKYIERLEEKANKYDSLVKKIEDKIKELSNTKGNFATYIATSERIKVLQELLGE